MRQQKREPDFAVYSDTRHASVYLLILLSDAARAWGEIHLPADAQRLGHAIAVEHRYLGPIVQGMRAEGLVAGACGREVQ